MKVVLEIKTDTTTTADDHQRLSVLHPACRLRNYHQSLMLNLKRQDGRHTTRTPKRTPTENLPRFWPACGRAFLFANDLQTGERGRKRRTENEGRRKRKKGERRGGERNDGLTRRRKVRARRRDGLAVQPLGSQTFCGCGHKKSLHEWVLFR